MVIGPGWGQDSVGTDGGVSILPDGSTVVGDYGETTVIKGDGSGVHTLFKSSDTDNEAQFARICVRGYDVSVPLAFARVEAGLGFNRVDIGRGDSGIAGPATLGRLYAGSSTAIGAGNVRLYWSINGVNVGTNPAAPTSGRAFQVTTTGQANAVYVSDTTGSSHWPWDAAGSSTAQVRIGASNQFNLYATATLCYVYSPTLAGRFEFASSMTVRIVGSGETHRFKANGVFGYTTQGSAPSGVLGDTYIDSSGDFYVHNGTSWRVATLT